MKNYYQILEVPQDASQDIIKEQYRFLVQAWHPDKFSNPAQKIKAEEKIKAINAAYAILCNPAKRADYDSTIHSSRFHYKQEYNTQEAQATQHRADDERRKRDEVARQKEEQLRKERANREKANAARESVKVFINGEERILSIDQLVHGRVQYFLEGERMGSDFFTTRAHVEAAVNNIAVPRGYEIHVSKLAGQEHPYRVGRAWKIKSVKVFVEHNGKLQERMVKETDLVRASIRYYFADLSMSIGSKVFLLTLQDVKAVVRESKENDFAIVVEKFAN